MYCHSDKILMFLLMEGAERNATASLGHVALENMNVLSRFMMHLHYHIFRMQEWHLGSKTVKMVRSINEHRDSYFNTDVLVMANSYDSKRLEGYLNVLNLPGASSEKYYALNNTVKLTKI